MGRTRVDGLQTWSSSPRAMQSMQDAPPFDWASTVRLVGLVVTVTEGFGEDRVSIVWRILASVCFGLFVVYDTRRRFSSFRSVTRLSFRYSETPDSLMTVGYRKEMYFQNGAM